MDNENKTIILNSKTGREKKKPDSGGDEVAAGEGKVKTNPPKKKHITTTKLWENVTAEKLTPAAQWEILQSVAKEYLNGGGGGDGESNIKNAPQYKLIIQHISQKLYSYRSQDILKKKFNAAEFVDISGVFDLLISTEMDCYYCHKKVMLLYEYVREPMQWSLDRIDNSIGHNRGNLYISCLSCNLHRRCLFPEKYVFTKKCTDIRKLGSEAPAQDTPYT